MSATGHHLAAGGRPAAARGWMRSAFRGVMAASLAGFASAVVTRTLMRVVEVVTNGTPHFSLGGLMAIAGFYVLCLLPGCIALALSSGGVARRASWVLFAAGTALLGFMAVNIGLQEAQDTSAMTSAGGVH